MKLPAAAFAAFFVSSTVSFSQQTVAPAPSPAPAPAATTPAPVAATPAPAAPTAPDANGMYKLHDGDDVDLKFNQDLTSKTAAEGDPVSLVLADDLRVGNVIVAKAGCKAVGEVTKAEKAGMMGKAGTLSIRLTYLKVGDTKVHLRGAKGKEGNSAVGATVALTVLFGPIGLIKHGHNIEIKQGQALKAFVDDDVLLPPAA